MNHLTTHNLPRNTRDERHATKSPSTSVEKALQISSFMQNKPNLVRRRRIANSVYIMNYKNFIPLAGYKNKPNSNPIKANFQKAKMNINSHITKGYRKKDDFVVRINKPNLVRRRRIPKMNVNLYDIEDYENKTAFRPQKNKPKTKPILERMKEIL